MDSSLRNNINLDQVAPACLLPSHEIPLSGSVSSQVSDEENINIFEDKRVLTHKNKARVEVEVPMMVDDLKKDGMDFFWLPMKLKFDYASTIAPAMVARRSVEGAKAEPTIEWLDVKVLVKVFI